MKGTLQEENYNQVERKKICQCNVEKSHKSACVCPMF